MDLKPSKTSVQANQPFTVTAAISDTFLDGSRVLLLVDGQPANSQWAWARNGKTDEVSFPMSLAQPGAHRLAVGTQQARVTVA